MKAKMDLSRIAGTLKYGAFSGESRKKILIAYMILASFFLIGMVLAIIALIIEQKNNSGSTLTFTIALIGIIIGFTVVPVIWLLIILRNEMIRKDIYLWLTDAVEIKGFAKQIDIWNPSRKFPRIKILVNFVLDGIHYTRLSVGKQFGEGPEGYHYIWYEYANKEIDIFIQSHLIKLLY